MEIWSLSRPFPRPVRSLPRNGWGFGRPGDRNSAQFGVGRCRGEVASAVEAAGRPAEAAQDAFGRLDLVVNNLGGTMPHPFEHTSPRYLAEAFLFNVVTAHALNRAALPIMLATGGGSIVGISSIMGRVAGRPPNPHNRTPQVR
ncbi:MAG: SDR family NAD(P)-dependent oxidoreductase [Acidimicrobiales bacterium]